MAKPRPASVTPMAPREEILSTAINLTMGNRIDSYNDPKINMEAFEELMEWAKKWQAYNTEDNACGSGHDAAMIMVYAKITRIVVGAAKSDNYIDAAAYLAMAWECHERLLPEAPNT